MWYIKKRVYSIFARKGRCCCEGLGSQYIGYVCRIAAGV
jgi:hypothetical protein